MRVRDALTSAFSLIPGSGSLLSRNAARGAKSPDYCYQVWMRHLSIARVNGFSGIPEVVIEIGPGGSLGVGACALLMGTRRYIAVDAVRRNNVGCDATFVAKLGELIFRREPLRNPRWLRREKGLAKIPPAEELFSGVPVDTRRMEARVAAVCAACDEVTVSRGDTGILTYLAPWSIDTLRQTISGGGADLVLSQSVLEYVDNPLTLHELTTELLRPGGRASHHIDLQARKLDPKWNGHWRYSQAAWRALRGRRPYFLNRIPASQHLHDIERAGLKVEEVRRLSRWDGLVRSELHQDWQFISDQDITTAAVFLHAIKPAHGSEDSRQTGSVVHPVDGA